jgi:hypothetical protein
VASYFLLNEGSRAGIKGGRSFMSFDASHASGLCRLHDPAVPEAAVALDEDFVRRIHQRAGLRLRTIRHGTWWNGIAEGHDVLAASSAAQGEREERAAGSDGDVLAAADGITHRA